MPEKNSSDNLNTWNPLSKKDRQGSVFRLSVILILITALSIIQLLIPLQAFSEFFKAYDEYRYLQTEMADPSNKLLIAMKESQYQLYKASQLMIDGSEAADIELFLRIAEQKLADATIAISTLTQDDNRIAGTKSLLDFIESRFPIYSALVSQAVKEVPVSPDTVIFTLEQTDRIYNTLANAIDELSLRINHRVVEMQYSLKEIQIVIRKRLINITIAAVLAVSILVLINIRFLFQPLTNLVRTSLSESSKYMKEVDRLERLSSLSRLVSGLAHEINTPIGNCITLTTYLKEMAQNSVSAGSASNEGTARSSGLSASELIYPLDMMYQSLDRAAGLVRMFKFVAAAQSCGDKRVFTLAELLSDIAYEYGPLFRSKNIRLLLPEPIPETQFSTYYDSLRLSIAQIISNSLHHAFDGTEQNAWTDIEYEEENGVSVFLIEDNGCGISADRKDTLFQPFSTLSHSEDHSGLGLYIAQAHVTGVLGGTITYEPIETGTRMKLTAQKSL